MVRLDGHVPNSCEAECERWQPRPPSAFSKLLKVRIASRNTGSVRVGFRGAIDCLTVARGSLLGCLRVPARAR